MKRILFLLAFITLSISAFSQNFEGITGLKYLGTDTADTKNIIYLNGEKIRFDTATVAPNQIIQRYFTGSEHVWTNRTPVFPNGLTWGGEVTRIDSLKFKVDNATYYILNELYTTVIDTVTLADPDATYPRIDIIAVDTAQNVVVITGTPNANPQKPAINHNTQIELTQVLVFQNSYVPLVVGEDHAKLLHTDWLNSNHKGNTPNTYATFDGYGNASLKAINDTLFTTIAISDETTALTTGTSVRTFPFPINATITDVVAFVNTKPTGADLIFDIKKSGTSIFSTPLHISAGDSISTISATPYVLSSGSILKHTPTSIDITQIGSTVAGAGAKIVLYYLKN